MLKIIFVAIFPCCWTLNCLQCENESCDRNEMIGTICQVDAMKCFYMEFENGSKSRGCANRDFDNTLCMNMNRRRAKGYTSKNYCALCKGHQCNGKVDYSVFMTPLPRSQLKCYNCKGTYCDETVDCDEQECYVIIKTTGEIEQGCRRDESMLNYTYCYDYLKKHSDPATFCNICGENLCNKYKNAEKTLTCYKCEGMLCSIHPFEIETCEDTDMGCLRVMKYGRILRRGCGHPDQLQELCDIIQRRSTCGICKTNLCNNSKTIQTFSYVTVTFSLFVLLFRNVKIN